MKNVNTTLTSETMYVNSLGRIVDAICEKNGVKDYENTATRLIEQLWDIKDALLEKQGETIKAVADGTADMTKVPMTYREGLEAIRCAVLGHEWTREKFLFVCIKPVKTSVDLLGKTASELVTNMKLSELPKSSNSEDVIGINAKLSYVTEYTGFSSNVKEQEGYFFPFAFEASDKVKEAYFKVIDLGDKEASNAKKDVKCDTENVCFLGKTEKEVVRKRVVISTIREDGVEEKFYIKGSDFVLDGKKKTSLNTKFTIGPNGFGEYKSLSDFITNVDEDAIEVSLQKGVTYEDNLDIPAGKKVTLNLNGAKLTSKESSKHTIVNNGVLILTDPSKIGVVDNEYHQHASLYNEKNAVCTVMGGTFTRSKENGKNSTESGGNSFYTIVNHGSMTIGEGVRITQNGKFSSLVENGWYDGSQNTEKTESVMIIAGGVFDGGLNTIKNDDYGVLSINAGTFKNCTQSAILNWNKASIAGGTFTVSADASFCILNKFQNEECDKGILKISGGKFDGGKTLISTDGTDSTVEITDGKFTISDKLIEATENSKVSISGGKFNKAFDKKYLAENALLAKTPTYLEVL